MTNMNAVQKLKLNIYVVHCKMLEFRKPSCEKLKSALETVFDINMNYISEYDPNDITSDDIKQFVDYKKVTDERLAPFNQFIKNMHINQLSNTLKHLTALKYISTNATDSLNMIIEDDIVYNDNVADSLQNILTNLPQNHDLIFFGLPASKDVDKDAKYQNVTDVYKILPCCDSYLISPAHAKQFVDEYTPIRFINNIQMSYIIYKLELKPLLCVPNIFVDGSKLGLYFSTLEVNNRLIFNPEYNTLAKTILDNDSFTTEMKKEIDTQFINVRLKTNPEFYYLKAIFETKKGNYVFAKAIYEYTYNMYQSNGTITNNQSMFLRDYLRLYKHLQN